MADLTLITCTADRPEAFQLCERWMARQTYRGSIQWIVADGDRRAKRTHFGGLIGVENGPAAAVSGSFEPIWLSVSEPKDADGGRLWTDTPGSS
jgi:hypothetical protein